MKKKLAFCIYGQLRLFKETCFTYNTLLQEISKEYDILFIINASLINTIADWSALKTEDEYKTELQEKSVFSQDELKNCMNNLTKEITPLDEIIILNKFENNKFSSVFDKIISYKLDIIDIINSYSVKYKIYFDKVFITRSDLRFNKLDIALLDKDLYCVGYLWILLSGHVIQNDIFKQDKFFSKQEEYINKVCKKGNLIVKYLGNLLNTKIQDIPFWLISNRCIKHYIFQIICFYELDITYDKYFNFKDFEMEDIFVPTLIKGLKEWCGISLVTIIKNDLSLDNIKKFIVQLEQNFEQKNINAFVRDLPFLFNSMYHFKEKPIIFAFNPLKKTDVNIHIPCGFRCFTKTKIREKYNIAICETLPFDNGFITPYSIKKILNTKYIHINLKNTVPCIKKTEGYMDNNKKGIKFVESSYQEINEYIEKNGYNNKYLDSTKGYYTFLKDYGCVLAHYNWHKSSGKKITDPERNLKIIEETINRRKKRLENIIKNSNTLHIYYDKADKEFMIINDEKYNLSADVVKEYLILTFLRYEKKIVYHEF